MNDLYNDSNFWRIFINVVGGVSILVALFLIYIAIKKIRHLIKGNRVKVLKDIYVTIYELPSNELKNKVQFGFELPIKTQLTFSIIDKALSLISCFSKAGILSNSLNIIAIRLFLLK